MTEAANEFTPNDAARAAFRAMDREAGDELMEKFFALWETEGDARRAGSMAAHAYIRNAARIAVFGARCAGHEPRADLWITACEEQFLDAVRSVAEAFIKAAIDEVVTENGSHPPQMRATED